MSASDRPFRIALALDNGLEADPIGAALAAETAGFDAVVVGDHIGAELAPFPLLAAIAASTSTIALGTMVANADVRNPVQLAWDAVTLHRLSRGRFELGLGAGHTPSEYRAMGMELDPPAVRKRRLIEASEVIARLLNGETVTHRGEFFVLDKANVTPEPIAIPLLIGGNGAALLAHAGRRCDMIGLQGLQRTLPDGHRHTVDWSEVHLERQLGQIRRGAGDRFDDIELSALVQVVAVTDDADAAIAKLCERVEGLPPDQVASTPYALVGTVTEIADKLHHLRDRWGISHFVVRDRVAFEPVLSELRSRTA